jgi:hypothetical protein
MSNNSARLMTIHIDAVEGGVYRVTVHEHAARTFCVFEPDWHSVGEYLRKLFAGFPAKL